MDDFPSEWCGLWLAEDGKAIYLEKIKPLEFKATIIIDIYEQLDSGLVHIDDHLKQLTTLFVFDEYYDSFRLRVEAGLEFIGPTYNLYPKFHVNDQTIEIPKETDDISKIKLHPEVQMGLYDDWEDDLGVPWGFPCKPFQKAPNEIEQQFKASFLDDEIL